MVYVLVALQILLGFSVVVLVLLHDGKDAGLSGAFGVASGAGGTQVMQRNLTRLTVIIAIAFVINSIALGFEKHL